jgi:O-antigen biosynthesis protein WbqP
MGRILNLTLALILLMLFIIPMIFIFILIKVTSRGSAFYWSQRIGRNNVTFKMPKFRSMRIDAPEVASHLLEDHEIFLTPIGRFLRRTSLDELPQLISIIRGDMAFVGPRPALFNQYDLIELRSKFGVHRLLPGITGLAQIKGRDELSIPDKVDLDIEYLNQRSFWLDLKIVFLTFFKVLSNDGVSH